MLLNDCELNVAYSSAIIPDGDVTIEDTRRKILGRLADDYCG